MSSYYHIYIPVKREELEVIKRDFESFISDSEGLIIQVHAINDQTESTTELSDVIKELLVRLLMTLSTCEVKRAN